MSQIRRKHLLYTHSTVLSDIFEEKRFSDVTLVSDDQIPFQAHKFVLSAFSPVFKNIFLNNLHSHPLIFLRGVNHQELNSILKFMYFGKASIFQDLRRFAQLAKDLQIKSLAEVILIANLSEPVDDNDDIYKQEVPENRKDHAGRSIGDESIDIPGIGELGSVQYKYEFETINKSRKHEGIVYSCQYCGYKATRWGNLKRHKESVHEGVKYPCNQCDYMATATGTLKKHQKSVHEGVKYSCYQCVNQFTDQNSLRKHQKSVHEGIKYFCSHCNYKATRQDHLKTHIDRKHSLFE